MHGNIKIAMLGTSGAGKTCYMVGMYAMMEYGYHGFTLSTQNPDDGLILNRRWDQMVDRRDEKRWPPPTGEAETKDYKFNFNFGLKPIMKFEWMDYRGGALSDDSTNEDVQELLRQVEECSCLFLCVSGEYLQQKAGWVSASKIKANRMNALLTKIAERLQVSESRPFPVSIVITKFDLCKERSKEDIIEDVKILFQGLFTPASGWLVSIFPVSLLGRGSIDDTNKAEIDPVNLHYPVAFAVYAKFRELGLDHRATIESDRITVDRMGSNWFKRLWNSSEINSGNYRINVLEGELESIQSNLGLLANELRNAPIFVSGQEVAIDV